MSTRPQKFSYLSFKLWRLSLVVITVVINVPEK